MFTWCLCAVLTLAMASLAAKTAPSSALFTRRASRRCVVMASASAVSQVRVWQHQEQLNRLMACAAAEPLPARDVLG